MEQALELNTVLMESTFRLEAAGSVGTGFVVGRPLKGEPTRWAYVLLTAAHVLESLAGEQVAIVLRLKDPSGEWQRLPTSFRIRDGNQALWVKHPEADVAAMHVRLPEGVIKTLLPTGLLANDETLRQYEVHPGDKLFCLGFPLGAESSQSGFAILRSGNIASYPLLPTSRVKTYLFDFEVFPGNSGGPVYFIDSMRAYGGATKVGVIQFIMGLVTKERLITHRVEGLYERREQRYPLALAEVVHASLIKETIELLPEPEGPSQ